MRSTIPTRKNPGEEGYLLVSVIFLLAILVFSLSVALPKVRESIQRDREIETVHRGKQYIRAIQLYYRRFGSYPPNIDALVKTNEIRFLRKRYADPITGKDDWKPIMFGQNKTPTAIGFFGEPLATGSTLAGTGPSGGNGLNGSSGSSSLFNSGTAGTAGSPGLGSPSTTTPTTGTGASGTSPAGSGSTSGSSTGSSTDSGSSTSSGSTSAFGSSNQTFGGAGIIGFSPASTKQSILLYKKKDHYNEWEFTYDPAQDRQILGTGTSNPVPSQPNPFGFGGGTGTGTGTPTAPQMPTTPHQ